MIPIEGLQGFALASACLQLVIVAVLWRLRGRLPARGMTWLAFCFFCGAATNLPRLRVPQGVLVHDAPLAPVLIALGLTALGALAVGMQRFVGRTLAPPALTLFATTAWMILVPSAWRAVFGDDLGGYVAAAGVYVWLIVACGRARRIDPSMSLGGVMIALACLPMAVVAAFALSDGATWLRYCAGVPFSMLGVMLLSSALSQCHHGLDAELALRHFNVDLEGRVQLRTEELREMVSGLEAFNRMVSHDLRGPLGGAPMFKSMCSRDANPGRYGWRCVTRVAAFHSKRQSRSFSPFTACTAEK